MNWQSPRPVLPVLHFSKVIRMMSLRAQLGNERSDVALAGEGRLMKLMRKVLGTAMELIGQGKEVAWSW